MSFRDTEYGRQVMKKNKRLWALEDSYRKANTKEVRIDNTDFAVNVKDGYVREWGTGRFYDPATDVGYQLDSDGQRIALTSYEAFGCKPRPARSPRVG